MMDSPIRVLVVDDEPMTNKLVQSQLTSLGYAIAGAAFDGPEAVELTGQLRPDVVLMDLRMLDPQTGRDDRLAGLQAAQVIQTQYPTPVILLTAYESPELVQRAGEAGVGAYLVKPASDRDLERAIVISQARFDDLLTLRRLNAELRAEIVGRKRAEEARQHLLARIREQAQQVQRVIDTVSEGVLLLDAAGQVVLANPIAQKDLRVLANAGVGDVLTRLGGFPLSELLTWPEEPSWHEIVASGRTFEIIARPTPIAPDSTGWVMVIRDMTRDREMQERLQRQERLAVIGQLAGGVAHEFNNILTTIVGYTQFALEQLVPGDPIRTDLVEVSKAADRAAALTRQLLAFSRKQLLRPEVLDLNAVVANIDRTLRRLIGENIELDTVLAPDLERVMADRGQVEQVIMNLAANARDAMPDGGRLTLETDNVVLDATYAWKHLESEPGVYVMLAVSDAGSGMDDETKAHLFEPFFTTREVGKGTGLGLATVYGIVKQSRGGIEVHSEPGGGTTFKVYLPRVEEEVGLMGRKRYLGSPYRGTETILLVEDEGLLRRMVRRGLEQHGYTVLEARLAGEAVRLSQQYPGPISLLIAEVVLPRMSGRDLAETLATTRPEMQVLYVSEPAEDVVGHHGVLEPGMGFLPKPFTPTDLARRVRQVLDV